MKLRMRHVGVIFAMIYLTVFTSAESLGFEFPEKSLKEFTPILTAIASGGLVVKLIQAFKSGKIAGLKTLIPSVVSLIDEISKTDTKDKEEKIRQLKQIHKIQNENTEKKIKEVEEALKSTGSQ